HGFRCPVDIWSGGRVKSVEVVAAAGRNEPDEPLGRAEGVVGSTDCCGDGAAQAAAKRVRPQAITRQCAVQLTRLSFVRGIVVDGYGDAPTVSKDSVKLSTPQGRAEAE